MIDPLAPPAPDVPAEDYGEHNENLPEDLKGALRSLITKFEAENMTPRVEEARRCQEGREFARGNQNIYWSGTEKRWKLVSATGGLSTRSEVPDDEQRYDYVENIYRANMLISMSVLTQNPPHCHFAPRDPEKVEDITTAKAAQDVASVISDNNKLDQKQAEIAYYWFTDGICLSHTYFDVSADRYGTRTVPQMGVVNAKVSPDMLHCPGCGGDTELPNLDYSQPENVGQVPASCPQCAQPLGADHFNPGVMAPVPQQIGEETYPQGRERVIYLGGLEVARPFYAKTLEECPWLTWETEVHKSWVKAQYPNVAEKIQAIGGESGTDSAEVTARAARVALAATSYGRSTSESWSSLTTFRRTWIRPWAFHHLDDDDLVQRLTALFPDGVACKFAGPVYLEADNERIEKKWAAAFPMPGDGMIRDGIGQDLIDVQRRLNTEENISTETFERGIPSRFLDDRVIDFDAYIAAGALACLDFPATPLPGQSVAQAVHDTPPVEVSPQMIQHGDKLRGPISQFLLGNFPSIFGGDTGPNDTASGISMVKDSAYGRYALFKRPLNEFYADTMLNAIDCARENRTESISMTVTGASGDIDAKTIHLEDLRGNLVARTEADESYPVSVVQKRATVVSLLANPSPEIQATVVLPENFELLKGAIGIPELKLPGEDARKKQYREIRQMTEGATTPVDVFMDQHDAEIGACTEWWSSDEGQKAVASDPALAERVRQHMKDHMAAKNQLAAIVPTLGLPQPAPVQQAAPMGAGEAPQPPQVQ